MLYPLSYEGGGTCVNRCLNSSGSAEVLWTSAGGEWSGGADGVCGAVRAQWCLCDWALGRCICAGDRVANLAPTGILVRRRRFGLRCGRRFGGEPFDGLLAVREVARRCRLRP